MAEITAPSRLSGVSVPVRLTGTGPSRADGSAGHDVLNRHLMPGCGAHRIDRVRPEPFGRLYARMFPRESRPWRSRFWDVDCRRGHAIASAPGRVYVDDPGHVRMTNPG